jgi:hypothetical protein
MPEDNKNIPEEQVDEVPEEQFIDESTSDRIAEFLEEDVPEEEPVEEEKEEEPVEEEPAPEPEPEEPPEPDVPLEEVIETTTKKVMESAGISQEEQKELEEEGFKFAWEERGEDRPQSWKEQSQETIRLMKWQDEKKAAEMQETEKQAIADAQERTKRINMMWDRQLDELRDDGYIPQVNPDIKQKLADGKRLTKEEMEDPGLQAQHNIIETMYNKSIESQEKGEQPITDIHNIYHRFIRPNQKKKPAGASAPVSGGRKSVPQETEKELSYDELHNMDFEDIVNM